MNVTNYKLKRHLVLKVTLEVIYSLIARFPFINLFCQDIVWSGSLLLVIIQIFKVGMNCEPIT